MNGFPPVALPPLGLPKVAGEIRCENKRRINKWAIREIEIWLVCNPPPGTRSLDKRRLAAQANGTYQAAYFEWLSQAGNFMFKNLNASYLGVTGHESEIIELALTYGFHSIDIDVEEFGGRARDRGVDYASRLIRSAGLSLGCFALPIKWEVEDDVFKKGLEKLGEYARFVGEIGGVRCTALVPPAGDSRPYHENFEFHRRRFSEICGALAEGNVKLALGFRAAESEREEKAFQFIHDFDALKTLVEMIDADNVGILLDVWDLDVSGGSVDTIRSLSSDKVVAVQLADKPGDVANESLTEKNRLVPSTASQIDVVGALTALGEIGYEGPITIKPFRGVTKGMRREQIVKDSAEALDEIWKAANLSPQGKLLAPAEQASTEEAPTEQAPAES